MAGQKQMKTILVADDDVDVRTVITMRLQRLPCRILEAATGDTTLDLVRNEHPDLVLLDWMMPGMSGIDILKTLRADPATSAIAVILMTGMDDIADRKQGLALGVAGYLVKPFAPRELFALVQRVLS